MSAFEDSFGKVNDLFFKEVLWPFKGHHRGEVQTGPAYGVDTSVIDLGNNQGLAITSDPLSLIPTLGLKESAWLSVHLLANDMATTGFSPMYAQFVLNLPTTLTRGDFTTYWQHIHAFCDEIGVAITGGHTGQITGQNSTIAGGGTMFLTAPLDEILTSNRAREGDVIVVTKETALTASSILASSFPSTISKKLGEEALREGKLNFYRTSSLPDARAAMEILAPQKALMAMHDVTEGGVMGCIYELAVASGCGFVVHDDLLPVGKVQKDICKLFHIDHRLCVGAGSMVMAVQKGTEDVLVDGLNKRGIKAAVVGELTALEDGFSIVENDEKKIFNYNGKDPYWEAFFRALASGWK